MRQTAFLLIKLAFVLALIVWLADRPGTAHIVWHGYVIETSAAFLALCVFAAGFVIYTVMRVWRFIKNGPETFRLHRKLNRLRDGQRQLTEGLIAVAAGNAVEAGRFAVGARKLLGSTPATQLLQAQAAQLAGDRRTAKEIFLNLAAEPESAVLGYRGLIMDALRTRNWEEAGRLAEKLHRLRPETPWLNIIRLELATRQQKWGEAETALNHIAAAQLMAPETTKQHQAAVLLAGIDGTLRQGQPDKALQAAERAVKLAPSWIPAIIALARQQMAMGHKRTARRTIEKVWPKSPHPQLAAIYRKSDESNPLKAYRRFENLCGANEDNPTCRLALAESALAADIWGEARRHLLALDNRGAATQNAYRLLARLERCESGNEQAALRWLTRAIDAIPDPVWLCRVCGGTHEEWQVLCQHCGTFDSLEWQTPGQSHSSTSEPVALLASSSWAG